MPPAGEVNAIALHPHWIEEPVLIECLCVLTHNVKIHRATEIERASIRQPCDVVEPLLAFFPLRTSPAHDASRIIAGVHCRHLVDLLERHRQPFLCNVLPCLRQLAVVYSLLARYTLPNQHLVGVRVVRHEVAMASMTFLWHGTKNAELVCLVGNPHVRPRAIGLDLVLRLFRGWVTPLFRLLVLRLVRLLIHLLQPIAVPCLPTPASLRLWTAC